MAEDYYKTLGVSRNASQAEIQKAYRDLARKYHPDVNPKDKAAKEKFQRIQSAFDVLNDPEKREMYDRYGSSFETMGAGGPRPGASWGGGFGTGPGEFRVEDVDLSQIFGERFGEEQGGGFADVFSQFRRARAQGQPRPGPGVRGRGADILHELQVPLNTAVNGGEAQIAVRRASGKTETIAVKIPAGIEDGKKIRIRGQGEPAPRRGPPGDILITIRVAPHPFFQRRGHHLHVKVPVTLAEAALGAKIDVPTPRGTVSLRVPAGSSSGTKLRVKGHGVTPKDGTAGDLLAEIQIVLPKDLGDADRQLIKDLDQRYPLSPRADLKW
ncbi:MAG: J domain-containing protein [Pirellulales bacterium]|nr:J domain-containing protein [Pirellulales bacterium]